MNNVSNENMWACCIVDSRHGSYAPQVFAEHLDELGQLPDSCRELLAGPDHDEYLDAWCELLDEWTYTDAGGVIWSPHSLENNVFLVAWDMLSETQRDELL